MSAYFIAHRRRITDSETLKNYHDVEMSLQKFGGSVLARSDAYKVLEGNWHPGRKHDDSQPERITVIEFPDMAKLEAWYNSADYATLKNIRTHSADFDAIAVEGA